VIKWVVEVYGYEPERFDAETKGKALYRAFRAFREAYPISFIDFLHRGVKVRKAA
jgi:hypothetical protein